MHNDMCRTHKLAIAAWLAINLLASGQVKAQAHGPPATEFLDKPEPDTPATHAAKLERIETWLKERVGRYRLSSATNPEHPGLLVDCVNVGNGPGLQCMTGRGEDTPEGEQANAAMQLYGIDPLALTIRRLAVNAHGIGQYAEGNLKGDTLVFPRTNCAIPENERSAARIVACEEILKIRTLTNGEELQFITEQIVRILPRPGSGKTGTVETSNSGTIWMKRVQPK